MMAETSVVATLPGGLSVRVSSSRWRPIGLTWSGGTNAGHELFLVASAPTLSPMHCYLRGDELRAVTAIIDGMAAGLRALVSRRRSRPSRPIDVALFDYSMARLLCIAADFSELDPDVSYAARVEIARRQ